MGFSVLRTKNFSKVRSVRIEIFNKELGLANSDIFDDDDKKLEQFLIISDEKIVGTFRLRETSDSYKIERMGILSEYRSKGFGKLTLEEIKAHSKKTDKSKIILDSIYEVRNFYAKSGFVQIGEVYSKVEIPHVKMYFELCKSI